MQGGVGGQMMWVSKVMWVADPLCPLHFPPSSRSHPVQFMNFLSNRKGSPILVFQFIPNILHLYSG